MIDPRNSIPSKPINATPPQSLVKDNAPVALSDSAVQTRAYELYELRGRIDGRAETDWYQAEADLAANKDSEANERKIFSKARGAA